MLILKRAYEHFDPFGLKCGRTSARTYNKDNNDAIRSSFLLEIQVYSYLVEHRNRREKYNGVD